MKIRNLLIYILIIVFSLSVPEWNSGEAHSARRTTKVKSKKAPAKKKSSLARASKKSKKKSKSKRSKFGRRKKGRRSRRGPRIVRIATENKTVLSDSLLHRGVRYQRIMIGDSSRHHIVHVVEMDMNNSGCAIEAIKAGGKCSELEKLQCITRHYDSVSEEGRTLAAVNANFWTAYSNTPIGPAISNGEIIEFSSHKSWSSCFFNEEGDPYFDRFKLSGSFRRGRRGKIYDIEQVNRRSDSLGICLYNRFGGDTIPYVTASKLKRQIEKAWSEKAGEEFMDDSTETALDSAQIAEQITQDAISESKEFSHRKLLLQYADEPAINRSYPCVIIGFADSAAAPMPKEGCVLSFGKDFPRDENFRIGDTLFFNFETNVNPDVVFYDAVSGTPRLVREGVASHEAQREGSTATRFVSHSLPRTAIGVDAYNEKFYLVAVEGTKSSEGQYGASLSQMAQIMAAVGCYDAMNLDGGGSSMMSLNYKNLFNPARPDSGRRISVGIAIVAPKNGDQSFGYPIGEKPPALGQR